MMPALLAAGGNATDAVMHHVTDGHELDLLFTHVKIPAALQAIGVSKLVVYQWIVAAFLIVFFVRVARRRMLVPTGFYNALEAILIFLKKDIADPQLGEHESRKWMPFLWTVFFVILFNNLLGLVPLGGSATGNIKVTAAFALTTFALIHVTAASHGIKGYFKAMVPTVPLALWPLLFVVEMFGYVAKSIALAVRLFANMVAGHMVFLTILAMIVMFHPLVAVLAIPAAVGIYFMELFVAALQAYVFTFLSAVFIGGVLHPHH